jgi:hypothetical protein
MKLRLALLAALLPFSALATPPDATFDLSADTGFIPASTTLTWSCKGVKAVARSSGNQAAWTGDLPTLTGTRKLTGIRANADYAIDCLSAPGATGFTISWTQDLLQDDGSVLTDLVGFDVLYGPASNPKQTTTRVPMASARSTFIQTAAGDYVATVQAVASDRSSADSNVVQKTAAAAPAEVTTISRHFTAVKPLPVPPVAQ